MSKKKTLTAKEAIKRSRIALQKGDKDIAHRWAEKAVSLAPDSEDAWLLLAASSRPQLSIHYLARALAINPQSARAQKGLIWAEKKLNSQKESAIASHAEEVERTQPTRVTERKPAPVGILLPTAQPVEETQPNKTVALQKKSRRKKQPLPALLITILLVSMVWALTPRISTFAAAMKATSTATFSQEHWGEAEISKPTYTPSPTATFTPTLTPINTSTETPLPTETARPTEIPEEEDVYEEEEYSYDGWQYILIDISEQHLYAYEGDTLVFSFVASTGMNNATATGSFSILNKIPSAYGSTWDIWMPYWLGIYWAGTMQNGIHALPIMSNGATLWAGYLGTPISYGCIVLGSYEAQLLYDWVDIGTPVDIQW